MNKQELQNEINKTKEHLANMEKMLAECECERWKPKNGEAYYSISETGSIIETRDWLGTIAKTREEFYNVFQTREQAEAEAEKILVRRMLEDIARRLNKGERVDWNDEEQIKYSIYLDVIENEIDWDKENRYISQGVVYCLDKSFYDVAIQEIGEERLKKYLRGE